MKRKRGTFFSLHQPPHARTGVPLCVPRYLVANGADLNPRDRFGNTPLDDAIRENHAAVAKYLRNFAKKSKHTKHPEVVALGSTDGRTISVDVLLNAIERAGIPRTDQRIAQAFANCGKVRGSTCFILYCHLTGCYLNFSLSCL